MPLFKRPTSDKTGGGFSRPTHAPKTPMAPLKKEGIDQELHINDLHVNEELVAQPLLMRKYSRELASLKRKRDAIQRKLELQESTITMTLSRDGTGRKVAEIEAMVAADESVQKLKEELAESEEHVGEYEGIVKAVQQRHDMLKELCANLRKEML